MDSTCCFIARELNITAALAAQLAPFLRDTETALPQMILFRSCKKLISLAKTWQLTMDMPLQEHTNGKAHKHAQRDGGRLDIDNTETHTLANATTVALTQVILKHNLANATTVALTQASG